MINNVYDVVIIGAGPAGLVACKEIVRAYHENDDIKILVVEETRDVGGLWNLGGARDRSQEIYREGCVIYDGDDDDDSSGGVLVETSIQPIYDELKANTPKDIMCFRDHRFPLRVNFLPSPTDVLLYLRSYAGRFRLRKHVAFGCRVTQATKTDDGHDEKKKRADNKGNDEDDELFFANRGCDGASLWTLTLEQTKTSNDDDDNDNNNKENHYEELVVASNNKTIRSKRLLVCNGHHSKPFVPRSVRGIRHYRGKLLHSSAFRGAEEQLRQHETILVVGGSVSGFDIAHILLSHRKKVCVSVRKWTPSKTKERFLRMKEFCANGGGIRSGISHVGPGGVVHFRRYETTEEYFNNDNVNETYAPDANTLSGPIQPDAIIFCTGYRYSYPFLSPCFNNHNIDNNMSDDDCKHDRNSRSSCTDSTIAPNDAATKTKTPSSSFVDRDGYKMKNLYMRVLYRNDPSLAFLGITTGNLSPFMIFEYQARFYARFIRGELRLPIGRNPGALLRDDIEKRSNDATQDNLGLLGGFVFYANELARLSNDDSFWKQFVCCRIWYALQSLWYATRKRIRHRFFSSGIKDDTKKD